ncbi:nuclear transport factor 2 family protein [Kitasatospora aureofaciens]|uniref:nuclear transport factor 2 family protein n=1 Tax=Kitasatospora aureofaciens TaxID=1894 RepID=UPI0036F4833B
MDLSSSHRAIESLIAAYAVHVDSGDFGAVGALLADALFVGSGAPVRGREAVEAMFQDTLMTYEDGTPRTKRVTTSTVIDIAPLQPAAESTRRELAESGAAMSPAATHRRVELTERESRIARRARDGRSNAEIGAELFPSAPAVEWRLHKVFTELRISSRQELRTVLP